MAIAFQSCDRIRITEFLPEYNLLDFLLNTPHIYDVKDYTSTYGCVADIESYKGELNNGRISKLGNSAVPI